MQTILVPSDFSENANTALKYAIQLANLMQSKLVVFHSAQFTFASINEAKSQKQSELLLKKDTDAKIQKLQNQVNNAYRNLGIKDIPSTITVEVEFNPLIVEKTIEIARKHHAGLIVMGTHGASGLNKLLFGSNTSVMISKSDIPVLAIPENYNFKKIETIALASDLESPEDELKKLMPFVSGTAARLDIVHLDYGIDPINPKEQRVAKLMEKYPYEKIRLVTQKANIEHTLLKQLRKYLDEQKPQWVVMFTKERSFWDKLLLGSKTEDMSNYLKLPLLSFKKKFLNYPE